VAVSGTEDIRDEVLVDKQRHDLVMDSLFDFGNTQILDYLSDTLCVTPTATGVSTSSTSMTVSTPETKTTHVPADTF
jgi:hypothetical protein